MKEILEDFLEELKASQATSEGLCFRLDARDGDRKVIINQVFGKVQDNLGLDYVNKEDYTEVPVTMTIMELRLGDYSSVYNCGGGEIVFFRDYSSFIAVRQFLKIWMEDTIEEMLEELS